MTVIEECPTRDHLTALGLVGRMQRLQALSRAEAALLAEFVDLLDVMDAEGDHLADGHRTVRNMLVAQTNTSQSDANLKVRATKTLRVLPDVRAGLATGHIGVAQVQ